MTHPKPFCVICSKKSEPLISFTNDTLNKCQTVLKIRKENDLPMSDVRLPENISSASKYHSKCYRQFTALLSKKYRKPKEIDFSETSDLPRIFKSQMWSHAAQQITTITNPIDYGWKEEDGTYTFKWFNGEQLPEIQDITEDLSENISVKLFYFFRTLANKYKYLFKVKFGMVKCLIIYNPEDVEIVLSGTKNTSKGFLYKFLEPWLKDGLLLSDGLKWQQRRKILTPTFHFNILRHFHLTLEENNSKLINQIKMETDKPKTNITAILTDYTLNSICETAMGIKLDPQGTDDGRRYKEGIYTLGQLLVYRSQRLWMYFNWTYILTETARKQQKVLKLLQTFRDNVINNRRKTIDYQNLGKILEMDNNDEDCNVYGKKKLAMLDLLLQAERMGTIDADGVGEEVDTFMFEGHDTTSTALQFLLMALANNPEVQVKAIEECDTIFGSSVRPATMDDLGQMKYIDCCIKESLRLYPPVFFFMRKFSHDTQLTNYMIPAGTDCTILVYDLHRRDDQFVEPLKFRPERFQVEPTWHSFSYVPFSAGPRNCIGQKFAMMEMKLAVSAILRNYRLLPVTKSEDIIFITDFILRSKNPIYVKFQSRI